MPHTVSLKCAPITAPAVGTQRSGAQLLSSSLGLLSTSLQNIISLRPVPRAPRRLHPQLYLQLHLPLQLPTSRHLNAAHRRLAVPLPCVWGNHSKIRIAVHGEKIAAREIALKTKRCTLNCQRVHVTITGNTNHENTRNHNIDSCWLPFTTIQTLLQSQVHQHQSSSLPVQNLLPERPEHVRRSALVIMVRDTLRFVFCQSFADEYGKCRREGFAHAVVFHRFDTRLEERFACRIALGDLEERLSGAERREGRPGVVGRRVPLLNQMRIFFRDGVESPLIDDTVPKLLQRLRCCALGHRHERAAIKHTSA